MRLIPTFVFISLSLLKGNALETQKPVGTYKMPDFAFPQTVIDNSESQLNEALKEGNQLFALRALMNECVARNILGENQCVSQNVSLVDSVALNLQGYYQSLAFLMEGEILEQAYLLQRNTYDERVLPLDGEFPEDPLEWSGGMYKTRILELTDMVTEGLDLDDKLKIDHISLLITDSETAGKIGLTLSQFIILKSVSLLQNLVREDALTTIPFYPQEASKTLEGQIKSTLEYLCQRVIDSSAATSCVKAVAMIQKAQNIESNSRQNYLEDCVKSLKEEEGTGYLLYNLWQSYRNENREYYKEIENFLKKFPSGFYANNLKYAASIISQQNISLQTPRLVLPNMPIEAEVNVSNVEKAYLLVYRLEENQYNEYDDLILKRFNVSSKPVQVIEVGQKGEVPFKYDLKAEINGLPEGVYVVIPSLTNKLTKGWNTSNLNAYFSTFRVSDIAILTSFDSNSRDSGKVFVVNSHNQKPIPGATVTYYPTNREIKSTTLITGQDGGVNIPTGYYRVEAKFGKSVARREAGFSYSPMEDPSRYKSQILTDLGLYHPGDTVRFAVVGWMEENRNNHILKNQKIEVTLKDANFNDCGKVELTLDESGRACGELPVPKGKLLGTYSLSARYPEIKNTGSFTHFLVEEYKLPGFIVTLSQDSTINGSMMKFNGEALTYSGLPVSDSFVELKIRYIPHRWFGASSNAEYIATTQTDSRGNFSLELPLENLQGTIYSKGRYNITAQVTSLWGETQKSQSLTLSLGNEWDIRPRISDKVKIDSDSVDFYCPVYDTAGLPIKTRVKYQINNLYDSSVCLTGSFESPNLKIPSSSLPSGKYEIKFYVEEESPVVTETILWRANENSTPYPTSLWVPQTEYTYSSDCKEIEISLGGYPGEWLLWTLSDGMKGLSSQWEELNDRGFVRLKIEIPDGEPTLFVNVAGMYDFSGATSLITITPQSALEKIEITTESFRDKIEAGNVEEWKFRFSIGEKNVADANVFAVMTDKALNSISDFKWRLNSDIAPLFSKMHLGVQYPGIASTNRNFSRILNYVPTPLPVPDWETYGYPWVSTGFYGGTPILFRSSGMKKAMKNSMLDMAAADASTTVAEAEEEAAFDDAAIEIPGAGVSSNSEEDSRIRPAEMPLAFFMTDLKTDAEGVVTLTFKVPDFNTTWQLQVLGYNDSMQTASLVVDAMASKPVMVKTNNPQFLRTGDIAQISATLFNNSDKNRPIKGVIEILDPNSSKVLAKEEFKEKIVEPSGNRIISLNYEVPSDLGTIIVRAYAISDNLSDGEEGLIPVLPSSTPVLESKTFFSSSDEELIEIEVPNIPGNANVTLKYCDNPLWEVIMSLPAFAQSDDSGSLAIASRLYGMLTTLNILETHPQIATRLKEILQSQDSTIRISNLQKDPALKLMALQETPWVNSAESENQRILSLSKYLEGNLIDSEVETLVSSLKKLQNPDGGWSWFKCFESSPFITSKIIGMLGYLSEKSMLTIELEEMAHKAVKYYDSTVVKNFERYRKEGLPEDYAGLVDYLYSRGKLGYPMSGKMKKIQEETFDSVIPRWRKWDVGLKSKAGTVLLSSREYKSEGMVIAESLKQFITGKTSMLQQGLMLELFEKSGMPQSVIESMAGKLFLEKETLDWGSDLMAASIINALIDLKFSENENRQIPHIFIDGKEIKLPGTQELTGNFTINLDHSDTRIGKIMIKRDSGIPAWGGVISQYIRPIKNVKKAEVEDLSIEKRIFKEDPSGKLQETNKLQKGDKVRVVLNVSCSKDMDYIAITDSGSACLQPDDSTSGMMFIDSLPVYREQRSDRTSFFIERLPAGEYVISYECHADREGEFSCGIASIQCLYSPAQTAHSAGRILQIRE